jgi:predicted metalloenzyme YecM
MKQKLKTLEIAHDRIRNVKSSITSSFVSFSSSVNQIAEITASINAIDRFERTKRFVVIFDSTIFIENKAKFEHWLSIMQSKLKANVDWYSIERMTMTYVNIKLDEETYKHISIRLNKNSTRRYLIVNEMFDDLKKIYANSNKMQTTMNAFTRLTQINKYAEFHVFWNEFQRLIKEMNLSMLRRYVIEKYSSKSINDKKLIFIKSNLIYWSEYWLFDSLQLTSIEIFLYSTIYEMNNFDVELDSYLSRSRVVKWISRNEILRESFSRIFMSRSFAHFMIRSLKIWAWSLNRWIRLIED